MRVVASRSFDAGLVVTLISILMLTISGLVLSSNNISAADYYVDNFSIDVPVSCSLFNTLGTIHTAEVPNGSYKTDIGITTIKAYCNDTNGFSVYAIGYTGEEYGNNKLVGTTTNNQISTGTAQSGNTSNWAMKLEAISGTYTATITNSFDSYHAVPDAYTKVATYASATDIGTAMNSADGSSIQTTYAAYVSYTQVTDVYAGKVKYTLVHPNDETPTQPMDCDSGYICYFPNGGSVEGTMGRQTVDTSDTSATLIASNYSRAGYGFAGWSDAFDYATNANAHFYGPQEDITFTAGQYTGTNNGLALYAVWVKSAGNLQDTAKVAELCGTGGTAGSLVAAIYDDEGDSDESTWSINAGLTSISALTDSRDNQTYAIAKLTDGNCWMIENLRLDNTATLTLANTNNPLNDGVNVTLKHDYSDTDTFNTLSATSSVNTAPSGWCGSISSDCYNQSRLRTDNTANRATDNPNTGSSAMYSYGNYYNWYSATAGNGTYSKSSGTTDGDLCPAGWHLPYGSSDTGTKGGNTAGGFYYLANSIVATTNNTINSKKHRTFPNNYVCSGFVYTDSLSWRGSRGFYWSSTANSNDRVYDLRLRIDSAGVSPGTDNLSKFYGMALRCVASGNS
ncbi:hypothetical protein IJG26_01670 [Candidatus Saccharibacteria bacterium]|nr:hypothetical protein [Candidatus Saccharibacteria bacterium]